jgi:molecular chaperone HtpG
MLKLRETWSRKSARQTRTHNDLTLLIPPIRHVGEVENSPHLEAFKEKGYEVLYLVEPVDELLAQSMTDYESKTLKSVGKGTVKLGSVGEQEKARKELKEKEEEASSLLNQLQKSLDEHVKQARLSDRLVSSPACLVGTEMDYSPQLERLLQKGKGGGQSSGESWS